MKFGLILIVICLAACNKKSSSSPVATPAAPLVQVDSVQGTWVSPCLDYDDSTPEVKPDVIITHVISGTTYTYTEVGYQTVDGSCETAIYTKTSVSTLYQGSGDAPAENPTAVSIDVAYSTPKQFKALTDHVTALQYLNDCTDEASPVSGVFYDVTADVCAYGVFSDSEAVTQGTVVYSIAKITAGSPDELKLGWGLGDGTTLAQRHNYLNAYPYLKQ